MPYVPQPRQLAAARRAAPGDVFGVRAVYGAAAGKAGISQATPHFTGVADRTGAVNWLSAETMELLASGWFWNRFFETAMLIGGPLLLTLAWTIGHLGGDGVRAALRRA